MDINSGPDTRRTTAGRRHSPTRERLLREVERRARASTSELVVATGLHENTVRGHLERLHADGHVRREQQAPTGRGRPATVWCAIDPQTADPYTGLAATLAETLTRTAVDPAHEARRAGTAWGRRLAAERDDTQTDARGLVIEIMREQGFAPVDDPTAADTPIVLHRCPLLAAASSHSAIVCAVHEGMTEGIARTRDDGTRAELDPFAEGGVCLLRLHEQPRAAS